PLLEDRHAQPHAGEAGSRDAAAVAGPDDDRIVDRHRFAHRLARNGHATPAPKRFHSPFATTQMLSLSKDGRTHVAVARQADHWAGNPSQQTPHTSRPVEGRVLPACDALTSASA